MHQVKYFFRSKKCLFFTEEVFRKTCAYFEVFLKIKAANVYLTQSLFQEPGVILLGGGGGGGGGSGTTDSIGSSSSSSSDDSDEDSDIDVHRPVSPCNFTVIGANVTTGKSSLRSKARTKKVRREKQCLQVIP